MHRIVENTEPVVVEVAEAVGNHIELQGVVDTPDWSNQD